MRLVMERWKSGAMALQQSINADGKCQSFTESAGTNCSTEMALPVKMETGPIAASASHRGMAYPTTTGSTSFTEGGGKRNRKSE